VKSGPNPKTFLMLAVGSLVLGGGMTYMAFTGLQASKAELQKLQADAKDTKQLQSELAKSQQSLQDSAVTLQHLEMGVQDYAYVPTMLTELEKLGKTSGIAVLGVRPMPKPAAPPKEGDGERPKKKVYDELDIEVKGRGTYRSVMNFVQFLGKFPKIVAARTVEMTPKNDPLHPTGMLEVTVNLRAYVFQASTAGAVTPKATPAPASSQPSPKTAMKVGGTHEG
jgi:Tfp pilus assembly protein PilO